MSEGIYALARIKIITRFLNENNISIHFPQRVLHHTSKTGND